MVNLRPEDIIHKSFMHRLLIEIVDQPVLSQMLAFKGGTCAAMLGYLDRFSVDLDFDTLEKADEAKLREGFSTAFESVGLEVKLAFYDSLFFQLKYKTKSGSRNTLKVSASTERILTNKYQVAYFPEIDRMIKCQTIETMFANKLVAVKDRYNRYQAIAGRDIYDIHHFFLMGFDYDFAIINERTGYEPVTFFEQLISFFNTHVNQKLINEDLNTLLPNAQFQSIRKVLIPETLSLLEKELLKHKAYS